MRSVKNNILGLKMCRMARISQRSKPNLKSLLKRCLHSTFHIFRIYINSIEKKKRNENG